MAHFGTKLALSAAALGAALMVSTPASADVSYLKMLTANMNTAYTATFSGGTGANAAINGTYASNGVTFTTQAIVSPSNPTNVGLVQTIFGFCIDVFHDIALGNRGGDIYQSNQTSNSPPLGYDPLRNDFAFYDGTQVADQGLGSTAYDLAGHVITQGQLTKIIGLVNTGLWLHEHQASLNSADTEMRLAAIQAAIWNVEVGAGSANPLFTITAGAVGSTYRTYFDNYSAGIYGTGNFANKADANDSFYVISDVKQPGFETSCSNSGNVTCINQSFAVGWPITGVPEPTNWALMILGFGLAGATLRRRNALTA